MGAPRMLGRALILRSCDATEAGEPREPPVARSETKQRLIMERIVQMQQRHIHSVRLHAEHRHGRRDRGNGRRSAEGRDIQRRLYLLWHVQGYRDRKERVLNTFDENGLWPGKGFGDHVTFHVFGFGDIANGMEQFRGYSVGTDPNGDQIVVDFASDGKFPADAKSYKGKFTFTTVPGSMSGSAVVPPSHVTRQNSGRRLREPSRSTAPCRATTNCRSHFLYCTFGGVTYLP